MPKAIKQEALDFVAPTKEFVEVFARVAKRKTVRNLVKKRDSGVDSWNLACALVLLWRAGMDREEMTEDHVMAALWLVIKTAEHPSCADNMVEYVCRCLKAVTEPQRNVVSKQFSTTAIRLWKRIGMRVFVASAEAQHSQQLLLPHFASHQHHIPPRRANITKMWVFMRKWVGLSTNGRN
ncbi:hypothetical protein DIPPA_27151 [Diplonema papillatum]|nr:hypothetical protein DIPPA_27151 [Diplonema papillatum]